MSFYLTFALLGLGSGALYAALASGILLAYRGSGVVNLSHGAMAMYIAYFFEGWAARIYLVAMVATINVALAFATITMVLVLRWRHDLTVGRKAGGTEAGGRGAAEAGVGEARHRARRYAGGEHGAGGDGQVGGDLLARRVAEDAVLVPVHPGVEHAGRGAAGGDGELRRAPRREGAGEGEGCEAESCQGQRGEAEGCEGDEGCEGKAEGAGGEEEVATHRGVCPGFASTTRTFNACVVG